MKQETYFYLVAANIITSILFLEVTNFPLQKFIVLYSIAGTCAFVILTFLFRILPDKYKGELLDAFFLCLAWPTSILMFTFLFIVLGISLLFFKISDYEFPRYNKFSIKVNNIYNKLVKSKGQN
jgi:hypothetical protein